MTNSTKNILGVLSKEKSEKSTKVDSACLSSDGIQTASPDTVLDMEKLLKDCLIPGKGGPMLTPTS